MSTSRGGPLSRWARGYARSTRATTFGRRSDMQPIRVAPTSSQADEWWRAVTALTLHVDVVHVAGNALAVAVLLPPLVQRFGAGAALWLLLLAGALGNVLAAMTHDPRHLAVGASTAAFGAVGVLV